MRGRGHFASRPAVVRARKFGAKIICFVLRASLGVNHNRPRVLSLLWCRHGACFNLKSSNAERRCRALALLRNTLRDGWLPLTMQELLQSLWLLAAAATPRRRCKTGDAYRKGGGREAVDAGGREGVWHRPCCTDAILGKRRAFRGIQSCRVRVPTILQIILVWHQFFA